MIQRKLNELKRENSKNYQFKNFEITIFEQTLNLTSNLELRISFLICTKRCCTILLNKIKLFSRSHRIGEFENKVFA